MVIYNVTTTINQEIHGQWIHWMRQEHIPAVMATGKFLGAKMTKVLVEQEEGGHTYSVQYTVKDRATLEKYYQEDAPRLRKEAQTLFGGAAFSFRTELELVQEFQATYPTATHLLFTYGTLQEKEVQLGVFSRTLTGMDDELTHYQISKTKVSGQYPTLEFTNEKEHRIKGKVYVLAPTELERADRYEGEAYKRIQVTLASGKKAWAYIAPNH